MGFWLTGKLGRAWHRCMGGAWVVHGSVHGAGWLGGGVVYFVLGLPYPVTSLLGDCYLNQ